MPIVEGTVDGLSGLLEQFQAGNIAIAPSRWNYSRVTELGSLTVLAWSSLLCSPLCSMGLALIPFLQGRIHTWY